MTLPRRVRVFVPGSIGNVGPGLDVLGLAFAGAGDTLVAERRDRAGIVVAEAGHPDLPRDPAKHTSALGARAVLARAGALDVGLTLSLTKGLPLSGGQGGSAASGVAGAVAANALLGNPLDTIALIEASLEAEATVAGRHADNIAPALVGGMILIRGLDPVDITSIPLPTGLTIVLAHPDQRLNTRDARRVLPKEIPLGIALEQAANIAAMVAGCMNGDLALVGRGLDDRIAEPAREPLLPGFAAAKAAALGAGALGASISGSGPTSFALCASHAIGVEVGAAMQAAYTASGVAATILVTEPDRRGAFTEILD
jgi:homoserine kinase